MARLRTHSTRPRVVVAGGGIAGVEAILALRELAGSRVAIELLAPEPDLVMRPLTVTEPFGTGEAQHFALADICDEHDVHLRPDALDSVDTERHLVETAAGSAVPYDALVVATGARRRPALPGALTFDGPAGVGALEALLGQLASGEVRSVAYALPDGVTWPLPLYELALMTAAEVAGTDARISLVTPEHRPLEPFGNAAHQRVGALLAERGVELRTGTTSFRVTDGFLLTSGGALPVDEVVALPILEGLRPAGLPSDAGGFLPVDEHCAVRGVADVWAAGDGTDAAVKQGGLAAQQADVAAEAIAARFGAPCDPTPFTPRLRAQLLTGALPWFFRDDVESRSPLWWPTGKVAARYLGPYLAERVRSRLSGEVELHDVGPHPHEDPEGRAAALDLALVLADEEAEAGEPAQALHWLDAAEAIAGTLPPEYVAKRRRWSAGRPEGAPSVRPMAGVWR
jgi:sulfide:quinone oxidoreductase